MPGCQPAPPAAGHSAVSLQGGVGAEPFQRRVAAHTVNEAIQRVGPAGRDGVPDREVRIVDALLRVPGASQDVHGGAVQAGAEAPDQFVNGALRPGPKQVDNMLVVHWDTPFYNSSTVLGKNLTVILP